DLTSLDFFFFFQAEDGIRDKLVTGVQTCALPISLASSVARRGAGDARSERRPYQCRARAESRGPTPAPDRPPRRRRARTCRVRRSEERRVGKECRARWAG